MEYFKRQAEQLALEKQADKEAFAQITKTLSPAQRRDAGSAWYPVAIRDSETGRGDYLTVEVERTTHTDVVHSLRFGMTAALFSAHDAARHRLEGTIASLSGNRLRLALRVDELPDWTRTGKLGVDAVFDDNSYTEMEQALKTAALVGGGNEGRLIQILTGTAHASFHEGIAATHTETLNQYQQQAVQKIVQANELAIVHGPPGTGKTTTLVHAIKELLAPHNTQLLVVAPSNTAVDLLSERLDAAGVNVVRIGNPARVNERQQALTLDEKIIGHSQTKEIKRLKKQAAEYRDLAQKYKRSFGPAEREQRNALFAEARSLRRDIEKIENGIADEILSKAQVITATLIGANHYTIRERKYSAVIIDEAGQALEPACWVAILKAPKLVMAGDHQQLPPTIRAATAAKELGETLLEKAVALQPQAVVLLQEQYRMNKEIMDFPSREFYGGLLQAASGVAGQRLFAGDLPVQFIDTAGCGFEELREGNRLSNREEAVFLVNQLAVLVQQLALVYSSEAFPTIGVIAPYRAQADMLKELTLQNDALKLFQNAITVNTVDSFQGQERDVIFISLTRSNSDSAIGFLSEIRRMNVAMTRARKKLVVIGDSATIGSFLFYEDFIAYAQSLSGYKSAWELAGW